MKRGAWILVGLLGMVAVIAACGTESDKKSESTAAGAPPMAFGTAAAGVAETARKAGSTDAVVPAQAGQAQAASVPATGGQGGAAQQLPGLERRIVYNVFLDLTAKDVQAGFERIATIAETNGGLVAESSVRQENDQRRASITIRVPSVRYQDVMKQIKSLDVKVESERSTGNDVTEEYTDLQSRQRNLEATEQQLLVFLGQAKSIQDVLQVQDRLNAVRADIERVKGRINLLTRLSDLATIQVQLRPEPAMTAPPKKEPAGAFAALRRGWEASTELLGRVAVATLTVVAFSWWLLPLLALGLWVARREQRRRAAQPATAAAAGGAEG